jgi:hypothetical protein
MAQRAEERFNIQLQDLKVSLENLSAEGDDTSGGKQVSKLTIC